MQGESDIKRSFPHGEDFGATGGGDTIAGLSGMAKPLSATAGSSRNPGFPAAGEDRVTGQANARTSLNYAADQIENEASDAGLPDQEEKERRIDFLRAVREAEDQALLYVAQVNRKSWSQAFRAFHNEHYVGSKYMRPDYRGRSKLFRSKTRSAVHKDLAAVAASMFNNVDAINCLPGNEADAKQRAAAAVMEELVNYRTDRASGKNSIPWFQVVMGARQDALLTGICLTKQSWKTEHRKRDEPEKAFVPGNDGVYSEVTRDVYELVIDRPDCQLIPPENFVIDPAADWTNPVQSAQYIILKWPMHIDEVRQKQSAPINPWMHVSEDILLTAQESGKYDMAAMRRAREFGLDRLDETQTGTDFQICWVYETFIRMNGRDWTFYSISDRAFLTEPKPVEEVYPEQAGERPLTLGFSFLEAHRIFPMSPVESWQMLQIELNDLVNLSLDALKQNVMPVSKIRRGKQVDLDQVKRRSYGSSIMVTEPDDVTWERPPDIPQSVPAMTRELELEFDDLAGQFNGQTAENNNALARTLGGLKLVSGSANAVQEYDIRVWIETWAQPCISQLVKLEQYYESDPVVLGLCGERAQLFEKHGISKIDDDLLEQEITIRVSVGLGAGDPQQRLMKFQMATQVVAPLMAQSKEFQSGQISLDIDAIMDECYGAVGYRDGGKRFIKRGPPQPNPMADLKTQELQAKIAKDDRLGRASLMTGLANLAKVALGNKEAEADQANSLLDRHIKATEMGFNHGNQHNQTMLAAMDHGHRHGLGIAQHRHQVKQDAHTLAQGTPTEGGGIQGGDKGARDHMLDSLGDQNAPQGQPQQSPQQSSQPQITHFNFTRDPKTGRISGVVPVYGNQ